MTLGLYELLWLAVPALLVLLVVSSLRRRSREPLSRRQEDRGPADAAASPERGARRWRGVVLVGGAALIVVCVGLALVVWGALRVAERTQQARDWGDAAVTEFHRLYNRGEYGALYARADSVLAAELPEAEALERLGEERDVSFGCNAFGSAQEPIRVEYHAQFARGEAWETFDWVPRRDGLRLLAFAVEIGFEDGTPDWVLTLAPQGVDPQRTTCTVGYEPGVGQWWDDVTWAERIRQAAGSTDAN